MFNTLIRPDELAVLQETAADRLLVCDCRFDLANPQAGSLAYAAGHIPGAVYLDLDTVLSGAKTGRNGRHPLPERQALAAKLAALGLGANHQLVAYDAGDAMFAARLWWLARWLGHASVAVLDGGLGAWRQAGYGVAFLAPAPGLPGNFTATSALVSTIDYETLRDEPGLAILDARAPDRFRGENETLDAVGGHIPGARNRCFRDNLEPDGRFKSAAALRENFTAVLAGTPAKDVVNSCGSGVTACHNLLAMELAGLPGSALYPGSWSEWSAQPGAPIETG